MATVNLLQASTSSCGLQPLDRRSRIPETSLNFPGRRLSPGGLRFQTMDIRAQARRRFSLKDEEVATENDLLFESPLRIVEYPDPRMRAKNKRIETFDDNLKKLVEEMFDVMYKDDGVGLAVPQVGMNVKLMVFNPEGEKGVGEEIVLVNPRVTKLSQS